MKSLAGKTIITTQPENRVADLKKLLLPCGANLISIPLIKIVENKVSPELENTLRKLKNFDWIIFTSSNGVSAFVNMLTKILGETKIPGNARMAVIGDRTAQELRQRGMKPELISPGNTSKEFAEFLLKTGKINGNKVLLPFGNKAGKEFEKRISKICEVKRIDVYKTEYAEKIDSEVIRRIENDKYDLLIFTSPSAFENFQMLTGYTKGKKLKIAAIGETTKGFIKHKGFSVALTPKKSNLRELTQEIVKYYKN